MGRDGRSAIEMTATDGTVFVTDAVVDPLEGAMVFTTSSLPPGVSLLRLEGANTTVDGNVVGHLEKVELLEDGRFKFSVVFRAGGWAEAARGWR